MGRFGGLDALGTAGVVRVGRKSDKRDRLHTPIVFGLTTRFFSTAAKKTRQEERYIFLEVRVEVDESFEIASENRFEYLGSGSRG